MCQHPEYADVRVHIQFSPISNRTAILRMAKHKKSTTRQDRHVQGTYTGHPRGFGFLAPERGGEDLFVPPGHEAGAIDGDTVKAERAERGTARVTRVVERGRPLLAGTYLGRQAFSPDAHRVSKILRVEGKARKGDKVLVAATPEKFRVRRVLGRAGAPDVEDAAVLAELEIAPAFPRAVLAAAEQLKQPSDRATKERMDLRQAVTVVTIDPVTSRDFDDAISLELKGDEWLLGVHIADVSHYVQQGSALDQEAHKRGTSVYLPNRVVPMLPEKLSNDLCSLREGVDRLAMSVLMRYTRSGKLKETAFGESVIRSDRRFSYERASRVMEGSRPEKGPVGELLHNIAELAALLRGARGSFDIPRGEIELVFNGAGDVVDVRSTAEDMAHGVIEEFMLAANRQVARLMLTRGVPTLFRHHPEPTDLSGIGDTFRLLGVGKAKSQDLRSLVAKAVEAGYGPAITSAVLRCMPRAVYTTGASSHFSLGFDAYCHFTSPIRRYADLVVHRQLREILRSEGGAVTLRPGEEPPRPKPNDELESLATPVNARAAAAERAESRIRRRRVLEFLLRQGGIPTEGQVTTVVDKGMVIDLAEYGTSGFLSVDALPGGPYELEPGTLRGRRRTFRLGDTLDVCIHRIDPASSQLDLALAPRY